MDSPAKLVTFLKSAANGELEVVPGGARQALKLILMAKKGILEEIAAAPPADVDNALTETARLALSLRSDGAPPLELASVDWGAELEETADPTGYL
jgi:hypothetical protein